MPKPVLVSNERRNSFHGTEYASQTYIERDFVTLDATNGKMRLWAFATDTLILGLSQAAASGTENTAARAWQIWPGDIIALDCYDSSASAAKDASSYIPGKKYELFSIGTGTSRRWYAEYSAAHSGGKLCLICEGIVQGSLRDKLKDATRYRGLFRFVDTFLLQHVGQ